MFHRSPQYLACYLSIALAMWLKVIPLSIFFSHLNPDWVLLFLIYWSLVAPEKFGVFNAWLIGLLVDVLTGRALGLNGLAYGVVIYFSLHLHKRLRQYPVFQQAVFVFCSLLFSRLLTFWLENLHGTIPLNAVFWLPVLIGTLCWPLVCFGLRFCRVITHIE